MLLLSLKDRAHISKKMNSINKCIHFIHSYSHSAQQCTSLCIAMITMRYSLYHHLKWCFMIIQLLKCCFLHVVIIQDIYDYYMH